MEITKSTVISSLATEEFVEAEINKLKRNLPTTSQPAEDDNSPKNYVFLTDLETGKLIKLYFKNGELISEQDGQEIRHVGKVINA